MTFFAIMKRRSAYPSGKHRSYVALAAPTQAVAACAAVPDTEEDIAEAGATSSPKPISHGGIGSPQIAEIGVERGGAGQRTAASISVISWSNASALEDAARGDDTHLVLLAVGDSGIAMAASHSHDFDPLGSGGPIFEFDGAARQFKP